MSQITVYSMLGFALTVDGLPVVGFFDGDDVFSSEKSEDVGGWLIGADGSAIWSQSADGMVTLTLKLQHTSPTHRQLQNKSQQQKAGSLVPFPVDYVDTNGGEGGHAGNAMVTKEPSMSHGKNATVREWVLTSPDWSPA